MGHTFPGRTPSGSLGGIQQPRQCRGIGCRGEPETVDGFCRECERVEACLHEHTSTVSRTPIANRLTGGFAVTADCDACGARIAYHLLPDGERVDVEVIER